MTVPITNVSGEASSVRTNQPASPEFQPVPDTNPVQQYLAVISMAEALRFQYGPPREQDGLYSVSVAQVAYAASHDLSLILRDLPDGDWFTVQSLASGARAIPSSNFVWNDTRAIHIISEVFRYLNQGRVTQELPERTYPDIKELDDLFPLGKNRALLTAIVEAALIRASAYRQFRRDIAIISREPIYAIANFLRDAENMPNVVNAHNFLFAEAIRARNRSYRLHSIEHWYRRAVGDGFFSSVSHRLSRSNGRKRDQARNLVDERCMQLIDWFRLEETPEGQT